MVRAAALFRHTGKAAARPAHEACRNLMVCFAANWYVIMGANEYSAVLVGSKVWKPDFMITAAQEWQAMGQVAYISDAQIMALDKDAMELIIDPDEHIRIEDLMDRSFPPPAALFTKEVAPRVHAFGTDIFTVLNKAARQFRQKSYRAGKTLQYEDTWVDFGTEEKDPGRTLYAWTGERNSMVAVAAGRIRNTDFS